MNNGADKLNLRRVFEDYVKGVSTK